MSISCSFGYSKYMNPQLQQLRAKMTEAGADFYYVPAADAHRNEYVPACWQRRAWISQFSGSAGDALVGLNQAYLWTDGRYFLQAEQQLDPKFFQLMKQQQGTPPIDVWLKENSAGKTCAVDPKVLTMAQAEKWQSALSEVDGKLLAVDNNWIDAIWQDQPAIPKKRIEILDKRYTGLNASKKLHAYRKALTDNGADAEVLTRLDAIAWLFNFRGKDIDYNPLAICYAIVTQGTATLFIDPEKLNDVDRIHFQQHKIDVRAYDDFQTALHELNGSVLLDPNGTSWWTEQQLKKANIVTARSPITLMKAIKNNTEQLGMREAHRIDAIAMVKFLYWLEQHWKDGLTEISASDRLEQFRRQDPRCQDLSFSTISGFASNGAIIHYFPTPETDKKIDDSALYLLDSGGQYREGTTDVTRTVHLGNPTEEEKRHYTLVLKGHLRLRRAVFPEGTFGEKLDPIARGPLQKAGYDYKHGTGHGVGCYLCVHEGPQMISPRESNVPLQPGMTISNEPGLYFEGQYGIRIENVCLIVKTDSPKANPNVPYYTLEDLTLVPYSRRLILKSELSNEEIQWINLYHQQIYTTLREDLSNDERNWLKAATKPMK